MIGKFLPTIYWNQRVGHLACNVILVSGVVFSLVHPRVAFCVQMDRASADRLFERGRYPEAADTYIALLRLHPRDEGLLEAMGQTMRRLQRPQLALRYFRQELEVQPTNRAALRLLGATLQECNILDQGRSVLVELTKSEPEVSINWYHLGMLMYQNGYYPAAIDAFNRALAKKFEESNRAEVVRAVSLLQAGRSSEASRVIPKLLTRPENAKNLDLLLSYVQILCEDGKYGEALKQDAVALGSAPANANAHFWRARIFQQQNRIAEAIQEAEQARNLSPSSPSPRNLLVRLYFKQGRAADASREANWLRRSEAAANGRQTNGPTR